MARLPQRRSRRALLLVGAPLLTLLLLSIIANPLLAWRARHRIEQRFGDVDSVQIHRAPFSWLTGSSVRAKVALGDATINRGGASILGQGDKLDELDLTADSLRLPRVTLQHVRIVRDGDQVTARAALPPQTIKLGGRSVRVVPEARDGALVLRTQGMPLVPQLELRGGAAGVQATVVGGPLDGRTMVVGKRGGEAPARIDRLGAEDRDGTVVVSAALTRQDA